MNVGSAVIATATLAVIMCFCAVDATAAPADRLSVAANRDSLEAMVNILSIDPATSQPRSRYAFREMDLAQIADTLVARLERYTGIAAVRQTFELDYHDSTFVVENLICRIPASGPSSGVLLVTAHFDAIANRGQDDWNEDWKYLEAPGADDNATGVASVLEAARVLAPLDLPFDVEFVLFTAEELGKLGSEHYVELCDEDCAERHLGVINADMIGYSGSGSGFSVMTDFRSGWLADMIMGYAAETDPDLEALLIKPGPSNWDHASFWDRPDGRLAAVTLSEPLGPVGSILYPYYHTTDDLPDKVDFEQTRRIASLINGFIASFEGRPAESSMLSSDLLVLVNGAVRYENIFSYGEEIAILARVRNTGGADAPEGAYVRLDVWIENRNGRSRIYSEEFEPSGPLRSVDVEVPLGEVGGYGGENIVTAEIAVSGMSDDPSDNLAVTSFVLEGTGGVIEGHYFRPNPVDRSFAEAMFCINTSEEIDLNLNIHSLEGNLLGNTRLGAGYGYPLPTGLSCHRCGDLFPGMNDLASGIYIYRILYFVDGVESGSLAGRFAVVR